MNKTHIIVQNAFMIGFLFSSMLLSPAVPIIGLILTPFIFHFILHTPIQTNIVVITLFIALQLFLSTGSIAVFVVIFIENTILLFFSILVNLFKPVIKNLNFTLYLYYFFQTHLQILLLLALFFRIIDESFMLLWTLDVIYLVPIIFIVYNLFLFYSTLKINKLMRRILRRLEPIQSNLSL